MPLETPYCRFSAAFPVSQTQLSHRRPSLVEDQAVHIVGEVGQCDLGFGALDADGADKQPHMMLFMGKDMLDQRAHLGLLAIGLGCPFGHRPAVGLAAVDLAGATMATQPCLVLL